MIVNKLGKMFISFLGLLIMTPMALAEPKSGIYSIEIGHSGKCLDVSGATRDNGGNVMQYDCHGGENQLWNIILQKDGNYLLKPTHSNKCLDIAVDPKRPHEGASKENFANVIQWECHGGPMQSWALSPVNGKPNTFTVKSVYSNKCLDISGNSKDNFANLHKYNCHGAPNQQFTLLSNVKLCPVSKSFSQADYCDEGGKGKVGCCVCPPDTKWSSVSANYRQCIPVAK
jgi:hypothetical protein